MTNSLPEEWHAAFIEFRKNNDHISNGRARQRVRAIRDDEWRVIEDEAARWENVSTRSAIARSSLDLYRRLSNQR